MSKIKRGYCSTWRDVFSREEAMIFNDNRRVVEDIYYEPNLIKWEAWRNDAIKHPNQQF